MALKDSVLPTTAAPWNLTTESISSYLRTLSPKRSYYQQSSKVVDKGQELVTTLSQICEMKEDEQTTITAQAQSQHMKVNKYKVKIVMNSKGIKFSVCDCKMGQIGKCKHVDALLFYLQNKYSSNNSQPLPPQTSSSSTSRKIYKSQRTNRLSSLPSKKALTKQYTCSCCGARPKRGHICSHSFHTCTKCKGK